jgi:hypothetical protein
MTGEWQRSEKGEEVKPGLGPLSAVIRKCTGPEEGRPTAQELREELDALEIFFWQEVRGSKKHNNYENMAIPEKDRLFTDICARFR